MTWTCNLCGMKTIGRTKAEDYIVCQFCGAPPPFDTPSVAEPADTPKDERAAFEQLWEADTAEQEVAVFERASNRLRDIETADHPLTAEELNVLWLLYQDLRAWDSLPATLMCKQIQDTAQRLANTRIQ